MPRGLPMIPSEPRSNSTIHRCYSAAHIYLALAVLLLNPALIPSLAQAQNEPHSASQAVIAGVARQPFEASVQRLVDALQMAGSPLPSETLQSIADLRASKDDEHVVSAYQRLLDPLCLAVVSINPESRVKVDRGPRPSTLDQHGWTNVLVKVHNEAGVTAPLVCLSPQAAPMFRQSRSSAKPSIDITPAEADRRWLDIKRLDSQPMTATLSGLTCEYRIIQLYARDAGPREATLSMHVGQGTQDLGFRSELPILFECRPAITVPLTILDHDGEPTTCSLVVRDSFGRVYPNPSRRLAPDFFFHEQVYRSSGESIELPRGEYTIDAYRGPEYEVTRLLIAIDTPKDIGSDAAQTAMPVTIQLKRWIHMARHGWFSGDHHVHAAGCAHYENPSEGVTPTDMVRHLVGEDLNIGCVLSWGPCWYAQKQFFDGRVSKLSTPWNLMRYDVEVSGFPSSHAGHLCLINLTEDDYPGTKNIEEWPSWTLPVLKWGKEQNGVVGYSHSGWGLALPDYLPDGSRGAMPQTWGGSGNPAAGRAADKLPDFAMPPFDGIGANEYIVTVAHDACDFISAVDTPAIWELNIWYHTLNCGFRTRISGETDFPCIYGERVGLGRSYVNIPDVKEANDLTYLDWALGLKDGSSYVGDGSCHITKFTVGDLALGHTGANLEPSQVDLEQPTLLPVRCTIAAMLPPEQDQVGRSIASRRLDEKPYWHIERARIESTRKVPVELIVNGEVAARTEIEADGMLQDVEFDCQIDQSSWIAVRVFPTMHTNPIFAIVGGKPIRANAESAQWCCDAVDVCWNQKRGQIRHEELNAAKEAYDFARAAYDMIYHESIK